MECGQQQNAALEALGVTGGGDSDIEGSPWLSEGGKIRGNHYGRDITHLHRRGRNLNSEALQNVGQGLRREDGLLAVSGSTEADDNTVADEWIFADAGDSRDITNKNLAVFVSGSNTSVQRHHQHAKHAKVETQLQNKPAHSHSHFKIQSAKAACA